MHQSQRGAITVEATLCFTMFIFAFFAVFSVIYTVRAQLTVQYALNQVAKEISQYCYFYRATDLDKVDAKFKDHTDNLADTANKAIGNLSEFGTSVGTVFGDAIDAGANLDVDKTVQVITSIPENAQDILTKGQNLQDSLKPYVDNPMQLVYTFSSLAGSTAENGLKRLAGSAMAGALMKKYTTAPDGQDLMKKVGIVGGYEGLNFGMSSILLDQKSVELVVVYQVQKISPYIPGDRIFMQVASTRAWIGEEN